MLHRQYINLASKEPSSDYMAYDQTIILIFKVNSMTM